MRTPDPRPRPCPASNVDLFPDKVIGRRKGKIARSTSMIKVEREEKEKKNEEEKFALVRPRHSTCEPSKSREIRRRETDFYLVSSMSCRVKNPCAVLTAAWYETDALIFLNATVWCFSLERGLLDFALRTWTT